MSESSKSVIHEIHPEFPNEPIVGAVGGVQPKLTLCLGADGKYRSPRRPLEEIRYRFEVAHDLVGQLESYFKRKKIEFPDWADEKNLERIRLALIKKGEQGKWPFSAAEQTWILKRLQERCIGSIITQDIRQSLIRHSSSGLEQDIFVGLQDNLNRTNYSKETQSAADQILRLMSVKCVNGITLEDDS